MSASFRLGELAHRVGGQVVGDPELTIRGVATLDDATADQLSFLTNPKYAARARETRAGALLVKPGTRLPGRALLVVAEPYLALAEILSLFHPAARAAPGVSPLAHVAEDAELGSEVTVAPFAVIESRARLDDRVVIGAASVVGRECRVGADTVLMPHVVLYPGTLVGGSCLIHSGVVLGSDGFGFATAEEGHHKVPQLGRVVVGDDVELGANTTVDRGTLGETVIGEGSKLDNLVMIAHGVRLGQGCLLAAQSGIAGSTRVGSRVTFAGQSGAAGHLEIADGTIVAAKSAVLGDVSPGRFVAGVPAIEHGQWKRAQVLTRRLPDLQKELRVLRRRLERLEAAARANEED